MADTEKKGNVLHKKSHVLRLNFRQILLVHRHLLVSIVNQRFIMDALT
jgi:hypothetical protein